MQQTSTNLQPDLIPQDAFGTIPSRAALMPWWLHGMLAIVLLLSLTFAAACLALLLLEEAPGSQRFYVFLYRTTFSLIVIMGTLVSVSSILLWCRWKHAVVSMIISACLMSPLLLIVVFATRNDDSLAVPAISLTFVLLLVGLTIRLFAMKQEWKTATRK